MHSISGCPIKEQCQRRDMVVALEEKARSKNCNSRITWMSVAGDYPEARACLAAFLVFGSAEVLAGVKPANLVRISNSTFACGRNMFQLWREYGAELLQQNELEVATVHSSANSSLLLIYHPDLLRRRLAGRGAKAFLKMLGYVNTAHMAQVLTQLTARFACGSIPHEIGLFLGYPIKDVAAFMGYVDLPLTSQRLWRIYGRSRRSEALADLYQYHHTRVAQQLRLDSGVALKLWRGDEDHAKQCA